MAPLPPRFYSVQYSGQYKLQNRELVFAISAVLFEQAAATARRKYEGLYSGSFFVDSLADALKARLLQQGAVPNEPAVTLTLILADRPDRPAS
jgi:hypothetical protein